MTLYTMNAYLEAIVSNAQYITAIYSDDGSGAAPVSLLAHTSPQVLGSAAWYSAPLLTPLHVTGGSYYWLGVLMDGWIGTSSTGTNSIAYSYDWDPAGSGFNWNNPPAKIPNIYGLDVNPNQSLSFSIYASGCPDNLITYTPTPTSVCAPLTCTPSITSTPTHTPTPTVTFTVTSTPT
jgi:hypothetical protein